MLVSSEASVPFFIHFKCPESSPGWSSLPYWALSISDHEAPPDRYKEVKLILEHCNDRSEKSLCMLLIYITWASDSYLHIKHKCKMLMKQLKSLHQTYLVLILIGNGGLCDFDKVREQWLWILSGSQQSGQLSVCWWNLAWACPVWWKAEKGRQTHYGTVILWI